jgi:hypothetical protein
MHIAGVVAAANGANRATIDLEQGFEIHELKLSTTESNPELCKAAIAEVCRLFGVEHYTELRGLEVLVRCDDAGVPFAIARVPDGVAGIPAAIAEAPDGAWFYAREFERLHSSPVIDLAKLKHRATEARRREERQEDEQRHRALEAKLEEYRKSAREEIAKIPASLEFAASKGAGFCCIHKLRKIQGPNDTPANPETKDLETKLIWNFCRGIRQADPTLSGSTNLEPDVIKLFIPNGTGFTAYWAIAIPLDENRAEAVREEQPGWPEFVVDRT